MSTTSELLSAIADVGADRVRGGYTRHWFDRSEMELREWFVAEAKRRDLDVRLDQNGNLWGWWGDPGPGSVVTGSHLDSVPGGGAFDGPLGVVSALSAVDQMRAAGFTPNRPLGIVVFAEEEGGRFGVPCLGSRLLTGAIKPDEALRLSDRDGVRLAEAIAGVGMDPTEVGHDQETMSYIGCFVELHVEQGRGLVDLDMPLGVASSILAHGRWRFRFTGVGNHAGTTPISSRADPMLPAAQLVLATRWAASGVDGARATVGRLVPNPGGANVIASSVDVWLDARAPNDTRTRTVVERIIAAAKQSAREEGCEVEVTEESYGDTVHFDFGLRDEVSEVLGGVPALPTGAGHDAGILAAEVPTAMMFVRNPTGVSHAPDEYAEPADCEAGAAALTKVLTHLTT